MDQDTDRGASQGGLKVRYTVNCSNCRTPFDAMESDWCACLATQRSLVCPHCLTCFCQAPRAYKESFWSRAPQEMWQRKMERSKEAFVPKKAPDPRAVRRPLVLVVEDEPEIRKVATMAVEGLGYAMILARDGREGLEMAEAYKPDLVLTDALMPRMDGREMCRRLKQNPETAGIKVLVMTSVYTSARYELEAKKKFGADAYLAKPLQFQKLKDLLIEMVGWGHSKGTR